MTSNSSPDFLTIFDMDGVIFATDATKGEGLANCFPEQYRQAVAAYNRDMGGVPRSDKFDYIFREICPELEHNRTEIIETYNEFVSNLYQKADLIPGVVTLLKSGLTINWLATSAPTKEAEKALAIHGIHQYFDRIYGYPTRKEEVLEASKLFGLKTIFFGDSQADRQSAKATKTNFAGVDYEVHGRFTEKTYIVKSFDGIDIRETYTQTCTQL